MPPKNNIGWTQQTWNPIIGCSKVSPGCDHCYAEHMAARLAGMGRTQYQAVTYLDQLGSVRWNGQTRLVESALEKPLHWKAPRRIFFCSMSDVFHTNTPGAWIDRVLGMVRITPRHTYQVLTKRAGHMRHYFADLAAGAAGVPRPYTDGITYNAAALAYIYQTGRCLPNLWLGVTAEDQERADERIPNLLATRAAVRFVSIEPMLEAVDLTPWLHANAHNGHRTLDWVIVGGETGPGARYMQSDWAVDIRDQCRDANVPFYFKRHSTASHHEKENSTLLVGREHHEFPASHEACAVASPEVKT